MRKRLLEMVMVTLTLALLADPAWARPPQWSRKDALQDAQRIVHDAARIPGTTYQKVAVKLPAKPFPKSGVNYPKPVPYEIYSNDGRLLRKGQVGLTFTAKGLVGKHYFK